MSHLNVLPLVLLVAVSSFGTDAYAWRFSRDNEESAPTEEHYGTGNRTHELQTPDSSVGGRLRGMLDRVDDAREERLGYAESADGE